MSVHAWIPDLGISWHLGVDGISLFLVVLTGVLFPIALIGVDPKQDVKAYTAWMLLLEAAWFGTFLAPRPVPVLHLLRDRARPDVLAHRAWGYAERGYAATKFFLFTMPGSALMLVAIVAAPILPTGEAAPTHLQRRRPGRAPGASRRAPRGCCSWRSRSRSP